MVSSLLFNGGGNLGHGIWDNIEGVLRVVRCAKFWIRNPSGPTICIRTIGSWTVTSLLKSFSVLNSPRGHITLPVGAADYDIEEVPDLEELSCK